MNLQISRRRFLISSTLATSTVLAGRALASAGSDSASVSPLNETPTTDPVSIAVSDRVVHEMLSGVGASWHSILHPPVSHGGSAFDGTPPVIPRHEKLWKSLEHQAEWLGLKFVRAEMDWRQWQPEKGRFTWDSPEMKILDRILSWAQSHGSDVMLQCMWPNVEWLAFPEYRGDPALVQASAPGNLDDLAEGWVVLLRQLIERRGYTCIRWINLVNEPNFYWWLVPPDTGENQDRVRQIRHLAEALRKVRGAVHAAKLPVKIIGPDFVDLPVLGPLADEPWWPYVDEVDFHCYFSCFDWEDTHPLGTIAYRLGDRLPLTLEKYRAETSAAGKGLFLTEFGSYVYSYNTHQGDNPIPGSFKASLKDTELLIRALNLGIDGLSHWSFVNRGDMDGQWQFVDTWDRYWKQWIEEAVPHRDAYYVLGLSMRHMPYRAQVLATEVQGAQAQGCQRVWVAAVRSPKDASLTVLIVNDADQPWAARLRVPGWAKNPVKLCSTAGASPETILRYESVPIGEGVAELILPAFSLTLLTDTPLATDAPGRW
jgi:hypothetical protein